MASISKSAMALAAFTALGTLTGCGVSGQQLSTDAMLVDFNGGSGSFKVYTMLNQSSGHKSKTFWNINYKSLYELDAGGNKIQGRGFPHLGLDITHGVDASGNHYVAGQQLLHNNLIGGAHVYMQHTLFVNSASIIGPDGTNITVAANTLKISFNISDWNFASSSSRLGLDVKMSSNGGGDGQPDDDTKLPEPWDGSSSSNMQPAGNSNSHGGHHLLRVLSADDGNRGRHFRLPMPTGDGTRSIALGLEDHAFTDGSSTSVPVAINQQGNVVTFVLPYFQSSVWYDPTVSTVDGTGFATSGAESIGAFVAEAESMIIAAVVAAAAAWLGWKV